MPDNFLRFPQIVDAYDDGGGAFNNFVPYQQNGHFTIDLADCAEDVGDISAINGLPTILVFNWYFRRTSQDTNYHNIDNKALFFWLAGEDINLYGGQINPFVVIFDYAPEFCPTAPHQPPSSGRYWLNTQPLALGTFPTFAETGFYVPNNNGWDRSYSRPGHSPLNPQPPAPLRPPPELRALEALGFGIQGHSQFPTGKIHVESVSVQ